MFKLPKEPMNEADMQPTWEYLVKQERTLKRSLQIARVIQPVGALICAWNLLLVAMNLLMFVAGDLIGTYFESIPILPSLVESMPRSSWGGVILFSILLAYIVPLAISGAIAGVYYYLSMRKQDDAPQPLHGTTQQCAVALHHKAENVYELRRKMPKWSIYLETGLLTAIMALPFVFMFLNYASEGAIALLLVLALLILLVVLFVFFWLFAFVMYTFSHLNSLYYLSASEWTLYELYHWVCDYRDLIAPK